ncbi:MAG: serine/threonine protein kinase, partial [Deltaproteobacteria bacterium]|nr:serine/threonine protein kinase [Deltaproteobacteria bacterium]
RFHREAEAVSRLAHHNTVQVFDFGADQGVLYLVMEYVKGVDVGELVDREGAVTFLAAAPIFAQACASLMEAHERGVIHRDLKPENIVVTRTHRGRDFVKVLDFGLAKLSEREELSDVTGRGTVVGTPYYMSPEQIRGDDIDRRSDIYALGALMYKVLTGDPPFQAKTPVGVLTKHLTDEVVPPSEHRSDLDIDPRVDEIVLKCLSKEPGDRYQSANDLSEAIEVLYSELDTSSQISRQLYVGSGATPVPRPSTNSDASGPLAFDFDEADFLRRSDIDAYEKRIRRRRVFRAVIVPLILLAAAAGGVYWYTWQSELPKTAEVEPNNTIAEGTKIAAGERIDGRIGKRLSDREGDQDIYYLAQPPATDGTMTITVELIAQRNIDMELVLLDSSGTSLVVANGGGVGQDEWIRRYRVTGPLLIAVHEVVRDGLPSESISDGYQLEVSIAPVDPRLETEPNDLGGDANPIKPGQAITAHFTSSRDIDVFRFAGAKGRYRINISGAQRASISVDGKPAQAAGVDLGPDSMIQLTPTSDHAPFETPYTIDLSSLN